MSALHPTHCPVCKSKLYLNSLVSPEQKVIFYECVSHCVDYHLAVNVDKPFQWIENIILDEIYIRRGRPTNHFITEIETRDYELLYHINSFVPIAKLFPFVEKLLLMI